MGSEQGAHCCGREPFGSGSAGELRKQGRATNAGAAFFVFGDLCILEFRWNKEGWGGRTPFSAPVLWLLHLLWKGLLTLAVETLGLDKAMASC